MHFNLVDSVVERSPKHIVTLKQVSAAEEYLQDHFPGFPVLPGVLMLESMVQAARELLRDKPGASRLVLGEARALKYGRFVKPGSRMRVSVSLLKELDGGRFEFKGEATVHGPLDPGISDGEAAVAVSGRFTLRPAVVA
jgi:3-hydroxyacyl-[acyl-carrier-protein] dehydratase